MSRSRKPTPQRGQFEYAGLDRVLHEKARLGILTALVARPPGVLFVDLKELCGLTDGNLSRHVQVLHEARLVEVWKSRQHGRPQTLVRLSIEGREQFLAYLRELERVIRDARPAAHRLARTDEGDAPSGWVPA
jgi:DNA-binding MarR family transcriptional regulator